MSTMTTTQNPLQITLSIRFMPTIPDQKIYSKKSERKRKRKFKEKKQRNTDRLEHFRYLKIQDNGTKM